MSLCSIYIPCHLLCKFAEQKTKEQKAIAGKTSNLDTKVLESAVDATESTDRLTLSLVDVNEVTIQDSTPEEVKMDAAVQQHGDIEGKDDSKKSTSIINVSG